ncbi:hypothetical protein NP493_47g05049 [Ridgeia piscesae]|uniref:Tektin n=1 Tax=Ridgeia piscesae TaxID=27915 RepID=A0AAD9UJM0_RIDPI|nr:hypothetical protein NP493_47g05049 [Ridgeia piscesae]
MAKVIQPPPKFTHPEWRVSNQSKYANAEAERIAAERLIAESDRLVDETGRTTVRTQTDVNKKFDQRLTDIKYWNSEVDDKLDDIKKEIDALVTFKSRIEKAIEGCKEPLYISQQCLLNRQKRRSIDLVHDDPEKELLKEVETIQGALALLERSREQAVEQLRLNRKAKYDLECDLKDKASAIKIDNHNAELRNNSSDITFKTEAVKIQADSSTPDQWEDFSNHNILNAEKQCQNSQALRSVVDGILQATCNDMAHQRDAVNLAMTLRIAETRDTKEKLEDHLNKVLKQIQEMEDNIDNLEKAILAKEAPLQVSQTRLDNRASRPNIELCRDPVQYRLVEEVNEIEDSIRKLQVRHQQSVASLKALIRQKLDLEEDIDVKSNTLFIDETECMGMRKSINIQSY